MNSPATIYLKDYRPYPYRILATELTFEIFDSHTLVINRMEIERQQEESVPLVLDGSALKLLCVKVDDVKADPENYERTEQSLTLFDVPERATVQVVTKIYPDENTALEGLYRSGSILCTQNEPEGFRRITYFVDRPDNMSIFATRVIAEKEKYPILLANGNLGESGVYEDGRHFALWHDPYPKPSYLFALVAGDLGVVRDRYVTAEGREVDLAIYVDRGNESKCDHAMRSLKASMRWDERHYGRSYDLNVYNIVAVDSFNMGAMENKGLNIFNSHYVLADEETATDQDFMGIESVIAHEYFHNWTGNRITCRDWFQLTLKEGLTVFRDQCFSADMNSEVVQRIGDVRMLRERQFVEDAGPTAHPIKPDHYIEINNFYTATVYEKGAEVIRMLHTLLGAENYRKAMDLYFDTFDGQAVRTEDFLWAMQQHCPFDLKQFERWYSQERTPEVIVTSSYDSDADTFTVELEQVVPDAVDGTVQHPCFYPLSVGLLDREGNEIPLSLGELDQPLISRGILLIRDARHRFVFRGCESEPVLSLNRHFSAPVIVRYDQGEHAFLMRHEVDGFNRYEAAQTFATQTLMRMMEGEAPDEAYLQSFGMLLEDDAIDLLFKAQLLELPSENMLLQAQEEIDVRKAVEARDRLCRVIAERFAPQMRKLYVAHHRPEHGGLDDVSMGERALKNRLLGYLMHLQMSEDITVCENQFGESVTMTDRLAALALHENFVPSVCGEALKAFYERFGDETLVMNKYFSVIASSRREGTLSRVEAMLDDPKFDLKVPNLVRALIGSFARNLRQFHAMDGSGYAFVAQKVIELDGLNPQIAAGLAGAFKSYSRMNPASKAQMRKELNRILEHEGISKNVYEIVEKTLKA